MIFNTLQLQLSFLIRVVAAHRGQGIAVECSTFIPSDALASSAILTACSDILQQLPFRPCFIEQIVARRQYRSDTFECAIEIGLIGMM